MSNKLLKLKKSLIKGKLPVLNATLKRFNLLIDRPATTNQHLAEIIRSDIGYTLAVLRHVNASRNRNKDPIESVEHAISMIGVSKTTEIGQQLVPFSKFPTIENTALKNIYSRSFHASQYFSALALQQKQPLIEENSKAIRLMALAEVLLWTNHSDVIQQYKMEEHATLIGDFTEPLDLPMRELGLELAKAWFLPQALQQALSIDFIIQKDALSMTIANAIATETSKDWYSLQTLHLFELWSELTEIPAEHVANTVHQLAAETARQIYARRLPQPAFFIIPPALPKKTPDKTQTDKPKTRTLQQILTLQMKKMQQKAGVSRVMFAMLTPDRKNLKVRFVLGGEKTDGIRQFQANLAQKNIFSLLMKKPQGMHINRENQTKYLPLIPAKDQKNFKTDNLFAMSLFVKNKPIGLFIADHNETTLNTENYQYFKHYCSQAAKALGN